MTTSTPPTGSSVEPDDDSVGIPVGEIDIPPVENDSTKADDDR